MIVKDGLLITDYEKYDPNVSMSRHTISYILFKINNINWFFPEEKDCTITKHQAISFKYFDCGLIFLFSIFILFKVVVV